LILFGMQNRTFGPYLAANGRILIPLMFGMTNRTLNPYSSIGCQIRGSLPKYFCCQMLAPLLVHQSSVLKWILSMVAKYRVQISYCSSQIGPAVSYPFQYLWCGAAQACSYRCAAFGFRIYFLGFGPKFWSPGVRCRVEWFKLIFCRLVWNSPRNHEFYGLA
jgi:hypothetical protein